MTGSNQRPDPLVPPDTDIAGLSCFLLDVERLFSSELWACSTGEEFKAAMALWGRAWQQRPAGSLPNDDRILAAFSGAGSRWRKVKTMALRGFVLCSDNRYYHAVLCQDVMRAAKSKEARRERTAAATRARQAKADDSPTPPSSGKKLNGNSETSDRNVSRNEERNDVRDDSRNEVRHEERNVVVASTLRRPLRSPIAGQGIAEERDIPGPACEPVPRATAGPSEVWATRESFDRIEARCRAALAGGPQDLRIGPIARLVADGFDLEAEVVPALLDIAAGSRTPIRTWTIYADRVAERVTAQRQARTTQGLTPTPGAPVREEDKIDLGSPYGAYAEPVLRVAMEKFRESGAWVHHLFGPPPGQPGCKIPARLTIGEAA